ncbi:hypothetical protein CD30_15530 [Ureibacillus massiliensis 4400831 = CIP 108448 = CCUG 49529]|uniref:DUF1232 domain-containing protein n=1 Tax=Ureibacillus massiliensis 4400831 = CIP 108448 = CCUG 49529 TaxID=1211035 RepID=A0A0A3IYA6_9BACL|nr:YkvA family protein [Ureibacillus massiliensis]KGR89759.1 hypothetical protein CD30_15530 [Ureibacillus massiliensis 4400831 = CIP 108448 = CCUG 49529]RKJ50938.1 DUF1232 domain-containing protein [Butyricicoccus sp. 1XD8-22]
MKEDFQLDIVTGKEKHFSPKKFIHKIKDSGFKLGFKALHGAATLFSALKSSDMPKKNKLLIAGVLGYFILPTDLIADFLPAVGLADDAFLIMQAMSTIYSSITDEMKEEGHQLLKKMFGDKYEYNQE